VVRKELGVNCVSEQDPQLVRLADAIAQRVGQQRFHVWFDNSTRLNLKQDGLEISVPNDFISEWIGAHFAKPIQDAAQEVLGLPLTVRFSVVPQLFEVKGLQSVKLTHTLRGAAQSDGPTVAGVLSPSSAGGMAAAAAVAGATLAGVVAPLHTGSFSSSAAYSSPSRLRHELASFVVGPSNELAFNAATHVAEHPGVQYTPLFIHGGCGLGKSHLLQGICRRFIQHHPTKRWAYLTGEEFTNEFVTAMRTNKLDAFRRRMRELDLLVIDDVHFLGGKRATQEEFLHTFNAIEAMGRQVVMASDSHPKMIEEFGESLVNRFVSGMVVRVDPPNHAMRCEILRRLAVRYQTPLSEEVVNWIARRVTQNVRELEGAINRVAAHVKLTGRPADEQMAQEALGDLDRQMVAPVRTENIIATVCQHFALEQKELMSRGRERNVSLARSISMYLIRKMAKLSYPEIGQLLNKKNHSTVISACRRIDRALAKHEVFEWSNSMGDRREEPAELLARLEEHSRCMK
jgi:chromosomal replication initiator protein